MADNLIQQGNQAVDNVTPREYSFMNEKVTYDPVKNTAYAVPNTNDILAKPAVVQPNMLDSANRINIPTSIPSNVPTNNANYASDILSKIDTTQTAEQKQADQLSKSLADLFPSMTGQQQALADEQLKANVPEIKQNLLDIEAQIKNKQAELNQDDVSLMAGLQKIEDKSIPMEFITGQQQSLQRNAQIARAFKNAEIGVLNARAQAVQGNLSLAMDLAKQAVDLKYAPYKEMADVYQNQLKALEPILNLQEKKQARQMEIKTKLALQDIEDKKQKEKDVQEIALKASQFGAPPDVVANISKATSVVEAINAAGKYTSDPLEKILKQEQILNTQADRAYKKAQIAKIASEIKENQTPLVVPTVAGSKNDLLVQFLNTSKYKESLSASEREKISKAMTVIGQLGELQSNISKQNKTGFLKGKVNELMASFGQNADVGIIMAQLQAVVPNLARGTYGEVGVLTDADIANYRRTLPNLTSPKEQNDAVLALTLKTVRKSIENTLKTAAASKLDVSGFVSSYGEITKEIGQIENRLGVSKLKVNELIRNNPNLSPMIREMYQRGADDSQILEALQAN